MYQIWWIRQIWWCVGGSRGQSLGLQGMVSWVARTVSWVARTVYWVARTVSGVARTVPGVTRTVSGITGQSHRSVSTLSLVARTVTWVTMTVPLRSHQLHFQKHHTIFGQWSLCSLFEITFGHSLFKIVVSRRSHDGRNGYVRRPLRIKGALTTPFLIAKL